MLPSSDARLPAGGEASLVNARLRVLGPDHPSTLTTLNWLRHLQRDEDK
jgi:hypothetical protein